MLQSLLTNLDEEETDDSELQRMLRLSRNEMMIKLLEAADEDGSSGSEEAEAVTEDLPRDEEGSGGEGGKTGASSLASAEEDQQLGYLSLGARPQTKRDKK